MADIKETNIPQKRRGFSKMKKTNLRIDMTPMVDLGFLLITFFIFTTRLSEPQALKLYMPNDNDPTSNPTKSGESLTLTLLLEKNNKVFYYHGLPERALSGNQLATTTYHPVSGIGNIIREKQAAIDQSGKFAGGRNEMVVIIKATEGATYKNLVDALDEMVINQVKKYAVVKPSDEDLKSINQ